MGARTRGYTLIELLVVVSIIGLLAALIVPAVQSSREAARRLKCTSHLRQIGIALGQHESSFGHYPSGRKGRWRRTPGGRFIAAYEHPRQGFYDLLPFLEQTALYNSINSAIDLESFFPKEMELDITAEQTHIGILLCPSDARPAPDRAGPSSYRFNVGMLWGPGTGGQDYFDRAGAFIYGHYSRPRDFTDGLSNTAGLSERLLGSGAGLPAGTDRDRDFWYLGVAGMVEPNTADEVLTYCEALRGAPLEFASRLGRSWDESSWIAGWYNHVAPPNARFMDCTLDTKISYQHMNDTVLTARSAHPGGANALMMDGSVRSIKNGINKTVWRALGTRSGGEAVSAPNE